jgi:hypothetical protein
MPNKCSQPEKDTDVFIGLSNQPVKLEERELGGQRESLPEYSPPYPLLKRIVTALFIY